MAVVREGRLEDELTTRYRRALPIALTKAGMVIVLRAHRIMVMFRPVGWATGHTARSLTVSPPVLDSGWLRVKIGPTTKYAFWVHFGRPPGRMPPVENILHWVREKHIAGSYRVVGPYAGGYPRYKRSGGRRRQQAEDLSAAWAIAKSIARKGTRPYPFLTVAFRQGRQEALRTFRVSLLAGMTKSGPR